MELKERMDRAEFARIQNEVFTALRIKANQPSLLWTECLKKAKEILDQPRS
jgi:hypothetical protein